MHSIGLFFQINVTIPPSRSSRPCRCSIHQRKSLHLGMSGNLNDLERAKTSALHSSTARTIVDKVSHGWVSNQRRKIWACGLMVNRDLHGNSRCIRRTFSLAARRQAGEQFYGDGQWESSWEVEPDRHRFNRSDKNLNEDATDGQSFFLSSACVIFMYVGAMTYKGLIHFTNSRPLSTCEW